MKKINGKSIEEHIELLTEQMEQYVEISETMIKIRLKEIVRQLIDERIKTFESFHDYNDGTDTVSYSV